MAGKIFTKEEADKMFGKVIESANINVAVFTALLGKTNKSVMFKILNGEPYILGDGRAVLHPNSRSIKKDEVFKWSDKSTVLELLKNNADCAADTIAIEKRAEHTTITYGANTIQDMAACPPLCP